MKIIKHIDKEVEIIKTNPLFIKELKRNSNYTCQACGLKYEKIYGNYSKNKDFIEPDEYYSYYSCGCEVEDINKLYIK